MKNKEWLKEEIESDGVQLEYLYANYYTDDKAIMIDDVRHLIDQLDEPEITDPTISKKETVEIPFFVADWIEHIKKNKSWLSLYGALNYSNRVQGETKNWLSTDNSELFARAWLDGYAIEPQKTLQVIVKNYDSTVYTTELPEDEAMKLIEGWKGNE